LDWATLVPPLLGAITGGLIGTGSALLAGRRSARAALRLAEKSAERDAARKILTAAVAVSHQLGTWRRSRDPDDLPALTSAVIDFDSAVRIEAQLLRDTALRQNLRTASGHLRDLEEKVINNRPGWGATADACLSALEYLESGLQGSVTDGQPSLAAIPAGREEFSTWRANPTLEA
jgi:hypothetical protein